MAFAILGTAKPAFSDGSRSPLASGTITTQNPSDSAVKASFPTAADADAGTNGTSGDITLDARGEPDGVEYWGKDGEDYKVIIKDSAAATVYTIDKIRMPGHSRRDAVTFTSTDATPTVAESKSFITAGTTNMTDFDDGQVGDTIFIKGHQADAIVVSNSAAVSLANASQFRLGTDDTLMLHMFVDQVWTEISRSNNADPRKVLAADATFTNTTLADVANLSGILLKPATYYNISGFLKTISDGNTQDLKIALQVNNAFQEAYWSYYNVNDAGTLAADSDVATTSMIIDIVTATVHGVTISGMCLAHASLAPTVDFQAAQGTDAGTTTLERGSWLTFEEVTV